MFTAVVAFCPKEIWYYACSPQNKLHSVRSMLTVYHHPSTYAQYLRNVLASWLLTNRVDVLNVVDKSISHAIESLTPPLSIFRQSRSLRTRQISLSLRKKRNVRDSAMSESHRQSVRDSGMSVTGKQNAGDSALSESHRQSVRDSGMSVTDKQNAGVSAMSKSHRQSVGDSGMSVTGKQNAGDSALSESHRQSVRDSGMSVTGKQNAGVSAMSESHRQSVRDSTVSVTGKQNAGDSALSESHRQSVSDDALSDSEHCERKVCLDDGKNEVVEGYQRALPAEIQELFPTQYEYIVESYTKHQLESFLGAEMHNFTLRVWTNCPSQSVAIKWIEEFQKISKTAYRVTRGSQTSGRRIIFKTIRHCQHQQKQMTPLQLSNQQQLKKKKLGREKSTRDKKTMCPSTLVARIYQPGSSQTSSHPKHPCLIDIHYNHNHQINSGHALSFRPVSDDVKQEYIHLFEAGHSSATARHEYTSQLQLKHDTQSIEQVLADRAANPNCQDIQRLFREWRDKYIGPENGEVMFDQLSQEVRQYTEAHAGEGGRVFLQKYETGLSSDTLDNQYSQPTKSKMKKVTDNVPFILAIVTPLMARAHQMLRQSGELVYCDSTASLDNLNTAVFILSSSTSAGAVPLGAVMTSSEDADTLTAAFMALRDILPDQAFFARGQRLGPLTFLTDDCSSERKALKATWPQAQLHVYFIFCKVCGGGYGMPNLV